MLEKLQLSLEHSTWLEGVRKIPCEIAAEHGVVSRGQHLAFEYRQNGVALFRKVRQEITKNGQVGKTFWIEPKDVSLILWNDDCLNEPCSPATPLVVTEGEFDGLACLAAGATHVVSVPNGAILARPGEGDVIPSEDRAFSYLWRGVKLDPRLDKFEKIILATDDDERGRVLRGELAVRLGRQRCWFVIYPEGCKDANDVLMQRGADALSDVFAEARPIVPNRLVCFSDIPVETRRTYSTGWRGLDAHMMLVIPELAIITGIPGAGKSAWALALGGNLAQVHGLRGAILQFEDNPERNRNDLLRYRMGIMGDDEQGGDRAEAVRWVDQMFRTISPSETVDDEGDFDLVWLHQAIEEAAKRHGCRWVIIDPWNEVEHLWNKNENEAVYLNRAIRQLKRIMRRFQVAIIIVAHPTKEGGKQQEIQDMSGYDIAGGAVWKNKSDHMVIVHRNSPADQITFVKIDKSKDFTLMGRPGIVRMRYRPTAANFEFVGSGV